MVIANYSPQHGQAGATSNMIAITLSLVLKYNQKILVMQSHFKMNNLEASLLKKPKQMIAVDPFDDYGIDSLIRNKNMILLDKHLIENSSYSFLEGNFQLLPGTRKVSGEDYEKESMVLLDIIEVAKECYDHVFIDVSSGEGERTNQILNAADLVIVNLCQNPQVMETFFSSEKVQLPNKLYVFGNYDCRSRYNITNLLHEYRGLDKKRTLPIEYCVGYRDAIWDADVIRFLKKNLNEKKKNKNYPFVQNVNKVAECILKVKG